jgi:outer membrane protein assembly factor BamB
MRCRGNFPAKRVSHQLHAVTDPEHRHADVKNRWLTPRRAVFMNALGTTRQDDAGRRSVSNFRYRRVERQNLAVDGKLAQATAVVLSAVLSCSSPAASLNGEGRPLSLDRQDGSISHFQPLVARWSVPLSAPPLGPPVISGDLVVVSLQPSGVLAFRSHDGVEAWRSDRATDRPMVFDDQRVYLSSGESIHALSLSKGEELWQQQTGLLTAPLVVQSGWVIAISAGSIAAYRADDGASVWRRSIGTIEHPPAIDGDVLFVPLLDREISALNLQTGETIWSTSLEGEPGEPLAIGGKVYLVARDKVFYTLTSTTGEVEWNRRVGAGPRGRPIVDDDRIYFVALDNIVRALDRRTGSVKWDQGLKYRAMASPIRLSGALVVPGAVPAIPVLQQSDGSTLSEITFAATLVGMSNVLFGPWNYPLAAVVTGDLEHPWTLSFLEPSTDPPPLPLVPLTELPGTTIPIVLPQ